jgi:hypothetical protein
MYITFPIRNNHVSSGGMLLDRYDERIPVKHLKRALAAFFTQKKVEFPAEIVVATQDRDTLILTFRGALFRDTERLTDVKHALSRLANAEGIQHSRLGGAIVSLWFVRNDPEAWQEPVVGSLAQVLKRPVSLREASAA